MPKTKKAPPVPTHCYISPADDAKTYIRRVRRHAGYLRDVADFADDDKATASATLTAIGTDLDLIEDTIRRMEDEKNELADEKEKHEDAMGDLREELGEANAWAEMTESTTFGDVDYRTASFHDSDIMEALDDCLRHGRKLHLLEYLKSYSPDIKAFF